MNRVGLILLHVVLPLLLGSFVYICWRPDSLLMFSWAEDLNLTWYVAEARLAFGGVAEDVPYLVRFVLPDAFWAYAFAAAMRVIWLPSSQRRKAFAWTVLGPLLAVAAEIGQGVGIVPGIFDFLDLIACMLAVPLAILLIPRLEQSQ